MPLISCSPARLLAAYLATGIKQKAGWSVQVGNEPTSPDETITIFDTVGYTDGRNLVSKATCIHHGIQFRIRSRDYRDGWLKLGEIQRLLDQICNTEIKVEEVDFVLNSFVLAGPGGFIGNQEKNKRCVFTLNGLLTAREV